MNNVIGREAILEIGGRTYTLARFDRGTLSRFIQWVKKSRPHPLEEIAHILQTLPKEFANRAVDRAMDQAADRDDFNSETVQKALSSPDGVLYLTYLLLRKHHPELTEQDVERLYDQAVQEHGNSYIPAKIVEAEGTYPETEKEQRVLQDMGVLPSDEKKG